MSAYVISEGQTIKDVKRKIALQGYAWIITIDDPSLNDKDRDFICASRDDAEVKARAILSDYFQRDPTGRVIRNELLNLRMTKLKANANAELRPVQLENVGILYTLILDGSAESPMDVVFMEDSRG